MTTAERLAFQPDSQEISLLIFDTDLAGFWFWDGQDWQAVTPDISPPPISVTGQSLYKSVADFGIFPNTQQDLSDTLNSLLAAYPGDSWFFPDGQYRAHLSITSPTQLMSFSHQASIVGFESGKPVIEVSAPLKLKGLQFHHADNGIGSDGLKNQGMDIHAWDCIFTGFEHAPAPAQSNSSFLNCTFTVTDQSLHSLGTLTWSPNATFTSCTFDGEFGADVMDSKFFNCHFEGLWGVHMPEGQINNQGQPSGYTGTAHFYYCTIIGTYNYGIGLGNAAKAILYNCVVKGWNSAAYVRTESTYEAYNTYFEATRSGGGSTALMFAKYVPGDYAAVGIIDAGDSYFSNCQFVNSGSENGYHILVPNRKDAGQAYFSQCDFDADKVCTGDTIGICLGDPYQYMQVEDKANAVPERTLSLSSNEVLEPPFSASGKAILTISGKNAPALHISIARLLNQQKSYPNGYQLVLKGGSASFPVTLKHGYHVNTGATVRLSQGHDLTLQEDEVVSLIFHQGVWIQTSAREAFYPNENGQLELDQPLLLAQGPGVDRISDDTALSQASDGAVPTEKAVKSYVDNLILLVNQTYIQSNQKLTLEVPAGYRISSLILEEHGQGSISGLRIGTYFLANDVVNDLNLGQGEILEANLLKTIFSSSQPQSLYIGSSNWGSGKLKVFLRLEKVI
ncbi:MAG: hypothetical protein AAFR61_19215 [Bacteroidota bacterium]